MKGEARGPIAVVGIGCRFPGGASDPASFWRLLESGVDPVAPMPAGRFDVERFVHPEPGMPGKMVTADGGFLEDIDKFDAAFFGLSPREARKIDPQHRLLLEVAWEALEDAGIPASSLAGRRVGVYVGVWSGEYENVMYRTPEELDFHSITGGGRYAASGRISYAFDLRGPALTVDTGCSASLVALHLARQAIESGEADLAIVGAANLVLQPQVNVGYSRSGMLSTGARCRFGDAGAAGYVRSDGAAALVLKPLRAARADGDPVRGVLLATGVNADGKGSGQLATPSADAQAELLETVYARAGVDPASVAYVEAHGTGTRAGDPVELEALGRVLGRGRSVNAPLIVGSVKSVIGHTEAAAGMAGLIKTLLALEHRRIPPNLHLNAPNETIAWGELRVEIPTVMREWPAGAPLIAGVSSFGITGTNAHAVVVAANADAEPSPSRTGDADASAPPADQSATPAIVVVSGASADALSAAANRLAEHLDSATDVTLRDLAFTTTSRREHHAHRLAIVADSVAAVRAALAQRESTTGGATAVVEGVFAGATKPRVGFIFSGQGSQWLGMGATLMQNAPVFAAAIHACEAALAPFVSWSLSSVLADGEPGLDRIDVIQPTLGAVQIALARQLEAWGVQADAVAGHSMGEVAAAHIAGALSLSDAMRVLAERSRLLAEIAGRGAMALLDQDLDEAVGRIARFGDRLSIAAINGPRSTVVSGDPEAVDELLEELEADDVFARAVRVDVASHSAQCEPLLARLAAALESIEPRPSRARLYSTVEGAQREAPLDAEYWTRNLRQPVRLLHAVRAMLEDEVDVLIEIAPHPILSSSLADIGAAAGRRVPIIQLTRREEAEAPRMLEAVARAHVAGVPIAWSTINDGADRVLPLPLYPWQRERFWLEDWEDWSSTAEARSTRVQWPTEASGWLYAPEWMEAPASASTTAAPQSRWLVVGEPGALRDATVRAVTTAGCRASSVRPQDAALIAALVDGTQPTSGVILLPGEAEADSGGALAACARTMSLTQALLSSAVPATPRLVLVTRGAQALPSAPVSSRGVAGASLWGFGRVLRDEQPELDVRLLDLDPRAPDADTATQIVRAAFDASAEADAAVRDGVWWVPRLSRVAPPPPAEKRGSWPVDGATLITGGLGDLGLAIARQLVDRGVRRLILAARTPLPPRHEWRRTDLGARDTRRIAAVLELEAHGASVHCAAVDVGDAASLHGFLSAYDAEAWPSIVAVVHTAGVIDSHLVRSMPLGALEAVFRGKVGGAWLLHRAFPDASRFVLFSSTSVLIPQAGEANYAAANAFLDALCSLRRAESKEAQVVNWGVWRNSGVIANAEGARYVEEVRRQGIDSMEPTLAAQVFDCIAAAGTPQLFVAPIDWDLLRETRGAVHLGPTFERLLATPGESGEKRGVMLELLAAIPAAERRAAVEVRLRAIAAQVLGVDAERIRADATLGSQGLDSLMALEFRNHIEGTFDLKVSATLAWNYPTLGKLSAHLLRQLDARIAAAGVGDAGNPLDAAVSQPATGIAAEIVGDAQPRTGISVQERLQEVALATDDDVLRELRGDA